MAGVEREEKYHIEGHVFIKKYSGDSVRFFCDGGEVDIVEWNRLLNENQPMSLLETHPNPLVRIKEEHRRASIAKLAKPVGGLVVADTGCERGHLAERLAGECGRLFCIDIDAAALDGARARLKDFQNIDYIVSDIKNIDLPDSSVDVCIASEVLEHLPSPGEGIAELVRITKPGGRIVISVPNELLVLRLKSIAASVGLGRSLGRLSSGIAVGHVQVFTKEKLRNLCEGSITLTSLKYSSPFFLNIFACGTPVK